MPRTSRQLGESWKPLEEQGKCLQPQKKTMRRANDAKRTAAATVPSNQGGSAPAESVPKNRNNNQASTQAGDDGNGRENNGKNDTENNDGEGTGNSEVVVAGGACKYF